VDARPIERPEAREGAAKVPRRLERGEGEARRKRRAMGVARRWCARFEMKCISGLHYFARLSTRAT
jgi:hypothetical protein